MTVPVLISIVVCTYNNAAILDVTLQRLALQRGIAGVGWDILVVDNNCTDETWQVVQARAASMPVPFRVVSEKTQGINPARVAGVRQSVGEWIAFIDDDCLLEPDWICEASRFVADHPQAGAFGGQVVLQWDGPAPAHVEGYGYAFAETRLGDAPLRRDWLAGAGMVLRRAALQATGWLDGQFLEDRIGRRLVSGGDVELGLRVGAMFEIWYAPRCVLRHSIPLRRTERHYLRRLVYGLGRSSHDVAALCWDSSASSWWPNAVRRGARLSIVGLRKAAGDVLHRRPGSDPILAVAFASGWASAMASFAVAGAMARRRILGRLAPSSRWSSRA